MVTLLALHLTFTNILGQVNPKLSVICGMMVLLPLHLTFTALWYLPVESPSQIIGH